MLIVVFCGVGDYREFDAGRLIEETESHAR